MYFDERGGVQKALRNITGRLDGLGIPYAVVGGMAMFAHGFRRFTEDVDLLVTPESMEVIRERLDGLGFVRPAGTRTKLRDTDTRVLIEFLITGGYPGDGKPKPVAFPDPATVAVEIGGIRYLGVPTLIELKLASGMTAAGRLKDLADVQELIRVLDLDWTFEKQLDPYVREKFHELWSGVTVDRMRRGEFDETSDAGDPK